MLLKSPAAFYYCEINLIKAPHNSCTCNTCFKAFCRCYVCNKILYYFSMKYLLSRSRANTAICCYFSRLLAYSHFITALVWLVCVQASLCVCVFIANSKNAFAANLSQNSISIIFYFNLFYCHCNFGFLVGRLFCIKLSKYLQNAQNSLNGN